MIPYEKYKDSGVAWIGKVPEHWEVKRLKYVVAEKLMYGANEASEFEDLNMPRYIRITDFGDNGVLRNDTYKSLPFEIAKDYFLKEGDILFARSGATVGKTFQFKNYEGKACFAGYLIKATADARVLASDFLYLYTKSSGYENWKNSIFIQATIQNIGADKYNQLEIPLPPLPEQTAIARYLDQKTTEIDQLIAQKERLLALWEEEKTALINQAVTRGLDAGVKMKDSGVAWLGEVPEHWEVKRLKYVGFFRSGEGITSEMILPEGDFPVFGGNGIRGFYNQFTHEGAFILIGRQGALCGNIKYGNGKFWASEHAVVVHPLTEYDVVYLGELLRCMNLNQYSVAAAQPGLAVEMIKNLKIPFPKIDEQREIRKFIETQTAHIQQQMDQTRKLIELLKEYRATLISEVVTGKIKITN